MKETVKYIGRWVIRFILMSIIFSTFQSCAKALEYNAIVEYVNQTTNYYSGNSKYPNIALNLQQPAIQTKIMEICENYNGVIVYYSSGYVYWKFYNDNDGIITGGPNALYYQGSYATFTGVPTSNTIMNFRTGNTGAYVDTLEASFRTSANQYNNLPGMNFTTCQIVDSEPLTYVGQGGYSPMDKLEFHNAVENTAYNGSTYTYYYQGDFYSNNQIYLGYIEPNDSYYFEIRLRDSNTNTIKGTCFVALNTTPYNFYSDGAITINQNYEINAIPRLLNYSTQYQLEITSYYGEGDTDLDEDIDWFIFLPQNAIVSGDIISSLGSGDFTNKDSANQIIDNNNSFFENLYNQMFTVSGEQVQQIINTTIDRVQIPSGEIAEIEQIFNYLSGDAGDFVISWTDKTTHFTVNGANISQMTIPARQINFSEMERQSPELQQAMHWARLITNISIFSILIHEAYICLLATLGVPVAIYGQKLEEKQQLAAQQQKQEQAWQNRLEQQRYNDWLYSHRKR